MTVHTFHASRIESTYNTAGDLALTPTADGVLAVQGNQAIVSRKLGIVAAWAAATPLFPQTNASIADVRIESPAFADINPASVRPLAELGSGIAADALGVTDLACEPLPLRAGDPLSLIASVVAGTAGSDIELHSLIFLSDGCDPIPDAPSQWVEFELSSVPATQGSWVATTLTFRRPLPGRRFAILDLDYVQQGALAARLALPGSALKPGALALQSISERRSRVFDSMHLGVLGTFDGFAPPTLEVYIPSSVTTPGTVARGWMRVAPIEASARSGGCSGNWGGSCGGGGCGCGR